MDVAAGDEAILFGPGSAGEPTAQDWAELLGTINYEVVTSPRGRVVRYLPRGTRSWLTPRRTAAQRRRRWLAGMAGLSAVGTVAGASVARAR